MIKKKKKKALAVFLWIIFIGLVIGIAYLSFQSGEDTKALGQKLILKLVEIEYPGQRITNNKIETVTYAVRQTGRAVAFLLVGVLGTLAIYLSWPRCNGFVKGGITAGLLLAIAFFTEKLKVYIPTRHYSQNQMIISMIAVTVGSLVVVFIILVGRAFKGISRLTSEPHTL